MMTNKSAGYWIEKLNLQPHPEGGYYQEVFRSEEYVNRIGAATNRNAITSIYYLLEAGDFSGFHRLASDELWYFHCGQALNIHVIDKQGTYSIIELSNSVTGNLQAFIPPHTWFAAELKENIGYVLVSCAVAPGFDFTEFEMARKQDMLTLYPQHQEILAKLCRN